MNIYVCTPQVWYNCTKAQKFVGSGWISSFKTLISFICSFIEKSFLFVSSFKCEHWLQMLIFLAPNYSHHYRKIKSRIIVRISISQLQIFYKLSLKRCEMMELKSSCASWSHKLWLESLQTIPPIFGRIQPLFLQNILPQIPLNNPSKNWPDSLEGFELTFLFDKFFCFLFLVTRITFETCHPCEF